MPESHIPSQLSSNAFRELKEIVRAEMSEPVSDFEIKQMGLGLRSSLLGQRFLNGLIEWGLSKSSARLLPTSAL